MNKTQILILLLSLSIALTLAAGCTSTPPVAPGTPKTTTLPTSIPATTAPTLRSLQGLLLTSGDLPPGYSIVYEGEMMPGDANCTANELCYLQGYSLSASKGAAQNTTLIEQAVMLYNQNATSGTISAVLKDQFPEIAGGNLTLLSDPALGDASKAYRFTLPTPGASLNGYLVVMGKGDVYEIVMVTGSDSGENLVSDLARKVAAKIP